MRIPLVNREREYLFSEDVIVTDSGGVDTNLAVMAHVSPLIKVLRLGRSLELVHQVWAQLTLYAGWVNVDVTWSRDEVLVSVILILKKVSVAIHVDSLLLCFQTIILNELYPA